ncbi:MAG: CgeB family protein [Janthinobacterium lividum]
MHVVVFGLTVSSSWGNGHATLWRSLIAGMLRRGHTVSFYERDTPYYAGARDLTSLPQGAELYLYENLADVKQRASLDLADADLALCTSYCPDGTAVADWILSSRARVRAFYDMDTPVTLSALNEAATRAYLPAQGLGDFDLVLSYTGGRALTELQVRLRAQRVAPLYGWVDPASHHPVAPVERFRSSFSYLGTYAADRQAALQDLFLAPAKRLPAEKFLIGGAQYPADFPWSENLFFTQHLEPAQHPAFFCSSRATLNITRRAMAEYGYCPSGRLFEAAACGVPLFTDVWEGLEEFFTPDELLRVQSTDDVLQGLSMTDSELTSMAERARARTLEQHTADVRVLELERLCDAVARQETAAALTTSIAAG